MQYRIHISIPVGHDREEAIRLTNEIVGRLLICDHPLGIEASYRLAHEEDNNNRKNHLSVNENGHVSTKVNTLIV